MVYFMLQDLGLSSMGLEHIEAGAFCNLRQLSILNLDDNKLQSLPELCALKCCLTTFSLSYNNISTLSKHFFHGYRKLKTLNLSDNKLVLFPNLHWIQHSLRYIRAADNKIQSLDMFETSDMFEILEYIDMGGNNIRMFNVTTLQNMPNLLKLFLNSNKLTRIGDFRIYYKKAINLVDNPWHCGTALSWMSEDDMSFEDRLVCETPDCLQGNPIADMSKYNKRQHIPHVQLSVLQENLQGQPVVLTSF